MFCDGLSSNRLRYDSYGKLVLCKLTVDLWSGMCSAGRLFVWRVKTWHSSNTVPLDLLQVWLLPSQPLPSVDRSCTIWSYVHTHACTHTRARAHTHTHTHIHACAHIHTRARANTHTHTNTRTLARTHARTYARTHARTHTHTLPRVPGIGVERNWYRIPLSVRFFFFFFFLSVALCLAFGRSHLACHPADTFTDGIVRGSWSQFRPFLSSPSRHALKLHVKEIV